MKKNKRIFLDIHALQTVPPSNINRDDTGSPKTCQYGGKTRARVSSQCWKRNIRQYFAENSDPETLGKRTLYVADYVADSIQEKNHELSREKAFEMAKKALKTVKINTKNDGKADALTFIGRAQADAIAEKALSGDYSKESIEEIMNENPAVDIALFGRMVASNKNLSSDASCQVAHAISVNTVDTEFDYFTAVDDFSNREDAGAGMIGTTEFDSSTLYRYANIAVHELNHQLLENSKKTVETVRLFIEAFVKSMPTGKANSFANQTLPSTIIVCVRDDRPVNLVTAYEQPVKWNDGFKQEASKRLYNELKKSEMITDKPVSAYCLNLDGCSDSAEDITDENSLNSLLNDLSDDLEEMLKE